MSGIVLVPLVCREFAPGILSVGCFVVSLISGVVSVPLVVMCVAGNSREVVVFSPFMRSNGFFS